MKAAMILLVAVGVIMICSFKVTAQDSLAYSVDHDTSFAIQADLDSTFGGLDLSSLSTGYLMNRNVIFVDPLNYQGDIQNDSTISAVAWRQLYRQMTNAHISGTNVFPPLDTVAAKSLNTYQQGKIPILILIGRYDKIKTYAVDSNLLDYDYSGDKFVDVLPRSNSPYEDKVLFSAIAAKQTAGQLTSYFVIDSSEFIYSNFGEPIQSLQIDYGDGNGFTPITLGIVDTVSYDSAGKKSILVRVCFSEDTLQSTFDFYVNNTVIPQEQQSADLIWFINANESYNGSPYANGMAHVFYGCGNTSIRKPIIFIEGFDPLNNSGHVDKFNKLRQSAFLDELYRRGYDFIFLNLGDGSAHIQRNAFLLDALIDKVNDELALNNSKHQIVLMGESMGGLIAKYALAHREYVNNPKKHNVRLYISFDSPHGGANFPIGLQALARMVVEEIEERLEGFVAGFVGDILGAIIGGPLGDLVSDVIEFAVPKAFDFIELEQMFPQFPLFKFAESPATKQMLYYYLPEDRTRSGDIFRDPLRTTLLNEFSTFGYPTQSRNVAITNGSYTNGTNQGFSSGDNLFWWYHDTWLLKLQIYIRSLHNNGNTEALFLHFRYKKLWDLNPLAFIANLLTYKDLIKMNFNVTNSRSIDNSPGGNEEHIHEFKETFNSLNLFQDANAQDAFSFVPTISSLDINSTSLLQPASGFSSPFDAVYSPDGDVNQNHATLHGNGAMVAALISREFEIGDVLLTGHIYLQNRTISNKTAFDGINSISCGSNVAPLSAGIPQGPLVVSSSADVDLRAGSTIHFKDEVSVRSGAALHAYIQPFTICPTVPEPTTSQNQPANKKKPSVAMKVVTTNDMHLSVVPNPANTFIRIQYELPVDIVKVADAVSMSLYDALGRNVRDVPIFGVSGNTGSLSCDLRSLPSGIYTLQLRVGNKVVSEKVNVVK